MSKFTDIVSPNLFLKSLLATTTIYVSCCQQGDASASEQAVVSELISHGWGEQNHMVGLPQRVDVVVVHCHEDLGSQMFSLSPSKSLQTHLFPWQSQC